MRTFAKVTPTFWTGATGRTIRTARDAQVVALYLITCPNAAMTGVYYLPLPTLCHEVGISERAARQALAALAEIDFAHYDDATEHVWVVEMARYQIGDTLRRGDKRVVAIMRELSEAKGCPFVPRFLAKYREAYQLDGIPVPPSEGQAPSLPSDGPSEPVEDSESPSEPLRRPFEGPSEALRRPLEGPSEPLGRSFEGPSEVLGRSFGGPPEVLRSHETETETQTETETETETETQTHTSVGAGGPRASPPVQAGLELSTGPPARASPLDPDGLVGLWNAIVRTPSVRVVLGTRRKHVQQRLLENPDPAFWRAVLTKLATTPFLRGAGRTGWRASLDWLCRNPVNAHKVLEGQYDELTMSERAAALAKELDDGVEADAFGDPGIPRGRLRSGVPPGRETRGLEPAAPLPGRAGEPGSDPHGRGG